MGKIGDHILEVIEGMADEEVLDKVKRLDTRLNEFGVDPFGFDPKFVKYGIPFALAIYRKLKYLIEVRMMRMNGF